MKHLQMVKNINKVPPFVYNPENLDLIVIGVKEDCYEFVSFPKPKYYGGSKKENFEKLDKKIDLGIVPENELFGWVKLLIDGWRREVGLEACLIDLENVKYCNGIGNITIVTTKQHQVEEDVRGMTSMFVGNWTVNFEYVEDKYK